jgi:nitrogen fixation/metabolism regulation signal transduction histidine kinase
MKKLKTKIVLLFMVIAILPAIPMALVVNSMIKRSVGFGVNARVTRALQGSLGLYREHYTSYRRDLLQALTEWQELADPAQILWARSRQLQQVEILSQRKKSLHRLFPSDTTETPASAELFLRRDPEAGLLALDLTVGRMMQVGKAYVNSGGDSQYVVLTRLLPEKFVADAAQVREVLQLYRTLDFVIDDVHRAFILSFLIVYLPMLVVAVAAAAYFSNRITAPLSRLALATEQVATGNWNSTIPEHGRDEVGQVINAFNRMVGQLQENQERLVSLEKMATWREIARVLAHEIKNPLTPIQLTIQQLRDKYDGSDPNYRRLLFECTDIIHDEVESLRNLVREFSDFARMPAMQKEITQIVDVIHEAVRLFNTFAITVHAASVPELPLDAEQMRRAFINLLENAVAAADVHRRIDIRVTLLASQIQVQVSDNGPGIAPHLLNRIFEPYFTTKHRGMGLGLAVVKKVIEEHGGKISAANAADCGAVFTILLPIHPPA